MPRVVRTIVKGDQKVLSVAAASVVAKTTRDAMMADEAEHYPAYGFESNRGYPAPLHKCALAGYGPSAIHRRSWIFMDYCLWGGIPRFERQPTLFSGVARWLTRPGTRSRAHADAMRARTVRELFAAEPDRDRMHVEAAGWYFDYAKHRVNAETLRLLVRPRRSRAVCGSASTRCSAASTSTSPRIAPVLHVALRMPAGRATRRRRRRRRRRRARVLRADVGVRGLDPRRQPASGTPAGRSAMS